MSSKKAPPKVTLKDVERLRSKPIDTGVLYEQDGRVIVGTLDHGPWDSILIRSIDVDWTNDDEALVEKINVDIVKVYEEYYESNCGD